MGLDNMSAKGITIYSVGCQPALSSYMYATEFFIACAQRTNGQAVALGSAASLADVILGAGIEEMDFEALQAKGVQARKVGGSRLKSDHAELVSSASCLAAAKASLCEKGPTSSPAVMRKKKCHRLRTSPTTDDWHDVVEDFEEEFAVYRSLEAGADGHRSAGIPPPPGEFPIYRSLGAGV